ncbi:hypothetical protein BU26DRAFT_593950 [Trematosphaeria pertusa]|uniref:F-box domain-containing protein n=1 Tax=Trematosphaeria pertusa TaxID=390896 RepID=A0A6A6IKR4_9PLEO|nr:uncharacterized protein BU26DRAFT_593950 [Trematosphaeria pertusa]KAF2250160.1 hypothetical protein BU26DRAFT_593950 [Trematosphaeria pertusa]
MAEAPTIHNLPQEILLHIVKSIDPPSRFRSQQEYYNLCLVKPFKPAATEYLYSWCYSYSDVLLLRTVLQHPELAALIRDLTLRPCYEKSCQSLPTPEDMALFNQAIQALGLQPNDEVRWIARLQQNPHDCGPESDGIAALLLLHAPNITHLTMDWGFLETLMFDQDCIAFSSWSFQTYCNLKSLELSKVDLSTAQIASLFRLPSLEGLSITLYKQLTTISESERQLFEAGTSNIKSLCLRTSIYPDVLVLMLDSCRSLTRLSCALSYPNGYGIGFDSALLNEALVKHKHCLRELALLNMVPVAAGTWTPFEKLETLWVYASTLYRGLDWPKLASIMPPNLQRLRLDTLKFPDSGFMGQLLDRHGPFSTLVEHKDVCLPRLRHLSLRVLDLDYKDVEAFSKLDITEGLEGRGVMVDFEDDVIDIEEDYYLEDYYWDVID